MPLRLPRRDGRSSAPSRTFCTCRTSGFCPGVTRSRFALIRFLRYDTLFPQLANAKSQSWWNAQGLYPLQALVQPISLRFKYHFQGSKNTNRVDKVSPSPRYSCRS